MRFYVTIFAIIILAAASFYSTSFAAQGKVNAAGDIQYNFILDALYNPEYSNLMTKYNVKSVKERTLELAPDGKTLNEYLSHTEEYSPSSKLISAADLDSKGTIIWKCASKYDEKARLIERTKDYEGGSSIEKFTYDPSGKLSNFVLDAKSFATNSTVKYDEKGRPINIKCFFADNNTLSEETRYTYGNSDNSVLIEKINAAGKSRKWSLKYSSSGVEIETVFTLFNGMTTTTINTLDSAENVIESSVNGQDGLIKEKKIFEYHADGRKKSEYLWNAKDKAISLALFEYGDKGLVAKKSICLENFTEESGKNNDERIKSINDGLKKILKSKPLKTIVYTYEYNK